MIAALVALALGALFLLDALSTRGQLDRLEYLPPVPDDINLEGYRLVHAPGVEVDADTVAASVALMQSRGWSVLHLMPGRMSALPAWAAIRALSPEKMVKAPLDPGSTAGHALIVTDDVAERSRLSEIADRPTFISEARRLKSFVDPPGALGAAVVPQLTGLNPFAPRSGLRALMGPSDRIAVWASPIIWLLMIWALVGSPTLGLVAVALFHLQLPIALLGGTVQAEGLWSSALLRWPLEITQWWRWLTEAPYPPGADPSEALRPVYTEELAQGTARFFAPRRPDCPMCGAQALSPHVHVGDLYQSKPGTFTLDRCGGCGHVFQNPALTLEGLDFYYRDFYDGLGGRTLEALFAAGFQPYVDRAALVRSQLGEDRESLRWLDVGCGHGHFCAHTQPMMPHVTFDGLDLGEAVEEATRRRWINTGLRGLFPELAPTFDAPYDVVSMSHYLEHTLDPRAELQAAATALVEGGLLFIEVPDPQCTMAHRLGRWWMPWLQPQHLHLMPMGVLEQRLTEAGFEVVARQGAEAHVPNDLTMALVLLGSRLAPRLDMPWRPRTTALETLRHGLVWVTLIPFIGAAMGLDRLLKGWVTGAGHGNAYRVVARKVGAAPDDVDPVVTTTQPPPDDASR
ncbi:MAG: methyltransferase domain-containing protein [Bradymonadia bacterium]